MAILKDQEEQKGMGTSEALGAAPMAEEEEQAIQPQVTPSSTPARIGSTATQPSPTVKAMPKQQKAGTGTFANLKSYLQAAQGGGQQRVAQAATQRVQNVATGVQKGLQQAGRRFGERLEAGSLAGMGTAQQEAADIIGAARGVTYQAPEPTTIEQPVVDTITPAIEAETQTQQMQTAEPAPAQPQQYTTPEQQQRFAEIINAQYAGPTSLQQAGLYEPVAERVRTAQETALKAQTAGGRESLLRDIFGRGRDYTRGASKLDALLLNTTQEGVEQLQQEAQEAGLSQQRLQALQNLTSSEAENRAREIQDIRQGARTAFTEARTEEEQAAEQRIDSLIKTPVLDEQGQPVLKRDGTPMTEWDRLPEYFRNVLANKAQGVADIKQEAISTLQEQYKEPIQQQQQLSTQKQALEKELQNLKGSQPSDGAQFRRMVTRMREVENQLQTINSQLQAVTGSQDYQDYQKALADAQRISENQLILSPEEAAVLGIRAGEGLYNIRPEDIQTAQAERARLITKDELARQLALSQLAEQDVSKELQKDLLYTDLEKAGTQDLLSSLDVEGFRRLLDEAQQGFQTAAEQATLTGTGSKKVSRGNWRGKKTRTYGAQVSGNVADMLRQAGYDVGAEAPEAARSLLSDRDLLNRYLEGTSTSRDVIGGSSVEDLAQGAALAKGAATAAQGLGSAAAATGALGAGGGAALAGSLGAGALGGVAALDLSQDVLEALGIQGASEAISDIRNIAASPLRGIASAAGSNVIGDVFRGLGGFVGGIDTGAMKAYGSAVAKDLAIQDLQNKYANWLASQGFENRANIADTETTRARSAALQDLLRRQS